jgi:hypothetical protein
VEAMSRFTGADPRQIHHLPRDKDFLIELPESACAHDHVVQGPVWKLTTFSHRPHDCRAVCGPRAGHPG